MCAQRIQISLGIRPIWSVFAVRMKKAWVLSYPLSAQRSAWSDTADAQADLSLRWAQGDFVGFVMSRLIYHFHGGAHFMLAYPVMFRWHPPSLISVFAVRMKKAWVLSYPLSAQRSVWSDTADVQADLSLRWAQGHFVGFVMSRLINHVHSGAHFMLEYPVMFRWHLLIQLSSHITHRQHKNTDMCIIVSFFVLAILIPLCLER